MTNPYLNSFGSQESSLYNDLVRESIYNHGINVKYLPRENFDVDNILGKTEGAFNTAFDIDAVIVETINFDADNELFQKFGISYDVGAKFAVHKDTFIEIVGNEPLRGDIIYLPNFDLMFEVTDADSMNALQFGNQFVFIINANLYENNHEEFNTGIPEIDDESDAFRDSMENVDNDRQSIENRFNQLAEFAEDNPFSKTF